MRASCAFALSLALPGCFFGTSDGSPRYREGTVVIDWTIDGSKDPALCDLSDAAFINIALSTSYGEFVGEFEQDCDYFATSIDLYADRYEGDAVLLSPSGRERTTPAFLGSFRLYGGDELLIPIDFPADSFY
jgi:hypothetical protein